MQIRQKRTLFYRNDLLICHKIQKVWGLFQGLYKSRSNTLPRLLEIGEKNVSTLADFLHTFSMALYYKWDVKNVFTFALQFTCLFLLL